MNEEERSNYLAVNAEDSIIRHAMEILAKRMTVPGVLLNSPDTVRKYLTMHFAGQEFESFYVLFLDVKNRVIHKEEMFRGTLTQTSVYPREVLKAALKHNAASVMFAHNHPSGVADPSEADKLLTNALKMALEMVNIRTLDHFIIAGLASYSFAEYGLI